MTHQPLLPLMAQRAMKDRRLSRVQVAVYGALFDCLDTMQHRYAKLGWLAANTRIREDVVSAAVKQLHRLGYLERGPDEPGPRNRSRRTYRMLLSPPMDESHTPATQSAA